MKGCAEPLGTELCRVPSRCASWLRGRRGLGMSQAGRGGQEQWDRIGPILRTVPRKHPPSRYERRYVARGTQRWCWNSGAGVDPCCWLSVKRLLRRSCGRLAEPALT